MRLLKRLFLKLLDLVFGARHCPPRTLQAIAPAKILVVAIDDRMGELLLAGPLIRALAHLFPAAEVCLLHAARFGWIAAHLPGVRRAIPFRKQDFFGQPRAFMVFLRDLRRERFSLAVDGGKDDEFSLTAALLSRTSGAPVRVSHRRDVNPFYTLAVDRGPAEVDEAARRLSLVKGFSEQSFDAALQLRSGRNAVTLVPVGAGLQKHRIGIYTGSRKADHRLDPAVYADVVRGLTAHRCDVVLIPGLDDQTVCEAIASETRARLGPILAGEQLITLVKSMDLFIANNTGPMHLAAALGVPTLGLFLKADPVRWGHAREPHRTLDFRTAPPNAALISRTALDMLGSA